MEGLPTEWVSIFERRLAQANVPLANRPAYLKWVKSYLSFCRKFSYPATAPTALGPFLTKLADKQYSIPDRHHAATAVRLLLRYDPQDQNLYLQLSAPGPALVPTATSPPNLEPLPPQGVDQTAASVSQTASWQREFRELETEIKLRNYSPKTLNVYRFWITRFQAFVRSRPTTHLSNQEVRGFLSSLAVQRGVSASSQNQAFNSLLFFFRHVLHRDFGKIDGVVRAKRHRYIPVVLSRNEVQAVLAHLQPPYRLVVLLLYGCGLRLAECVNLRIHCFNLDAMLLTVHDGKGQKDRTVPLPARALPEIRQQIENVRRLHAQDIAEDYAGVFLPRQLDKKYKNAAREFIWQWFFPAPTLTFVPSAREMRRYHLHESHVQGAVKEAATRAGITKRVSPHTFRHTFASHLLMADYDLQTIQHLLGHCKCQSSLLTQRQTSRPGMAWSRHPLAECK